MSEEDPRLQKLQTELDNALSTTVTLQERILSLEEDVHRHRLEFIAFRTWTERNLGRSSVTREPLYHTARPGLFGPPQGTEILSPCASPLSPTNSAQSATTFSVASPPPLRSLVEVVAGKKRSEHVGKVYRVVRYSGNHYCTIVNSDDPQGKEIKKANTSLSLAPN